MRFQTLLAVGVAATLSFGALAAGIDAYVIKYTPKLGDSDKYRMKVDLEVAGQPATFAGTVTDKVTKVNPDGSFEVQQTQGEGTVTFGGNEMPAPAAGPSTIVSKPNGMITELRGDDVTPDSYRMSMLTIFLQPDKPVNVGDSWTQDIKADPKTGIVAARVEYKVLGEEKVGARDTLKIKSNVKETVGTEPASSDGTVWLDRSDWELVKYEGKLVNAPVPGAPAPITGTISLTRID